MKNSISRGNNKVILILDKARKQNKQKRVKQVSILFPHQTNENTFKHSRWGKILTISSVVEVLKWMPVMRPDGTPSSSSYNSLSMGKRSNLHR